MKHGSRRVVVGVALGIGTLWAGLSGEVRTPAGAGLSGVAIALRGSTALTTNSGADGRWALGTTSIAPSRPDLPGPTRHLVLRGGRIAVVFSARAADGRAIAPSGSALPSPIAARAAGAADTLVFSLCRARTTLPVGTLDSNGIAVVLDTAGAMSGCDNTQPTVPALGYPTSYGNVTTYGGVDTAGISSGGACNYGITGIRFYAAIHVDLLPGDGTGQWQGGRACGQGMRVRAHTPQGVKETFVRIMDKCPDPHCGIDLGGAPAAAIMGTQAGRYPGEWTLVSCKGHPELFDGPTALWTKEGSSKDWSLVQVRNPWTAVAALLWKPAASADSSWSGMPWATEAENFFKVPAALFALTDSVDIAVRYVDSTSQSVRLAPRDLAREKASHVLPDGP